MGGFAEPTNENQIEEEKAYSRDTIIPTNGKADQR